MRFLRIIMFCLMGAVIFAGPCPVQAQEQAKKQTQEQKPSIAASSPPERMPWWGFVMPPEGDAKDQEIMAAAQKLWARVNVPRDAGVMARADAVRLFINLHSVHSVDEELYSYWHDMPFMMNMMDKSAVHPFPRTDRARRPRMECASRSVMMYHVLRAAGVRARFVLVHADRVNRGNHTFLEIWDPDEGRWSVQDPDANIYWRAADGRRTGVEDLLRAPVRANFTPCRSEQDCGYNDYINVFVPYLATAIIFDPAADEVPVLYNPRRVDWYHVARSMRNGWSFCVLYGGTCAYKAVTVQ